MTICMSVIDHVHFNVHRVARFREIMEQLFGPEMTPVGLLEPFGFYKSCVYFHDELERIKERCQRGETVDGLRYVDL